MGEYKGTEWKGEREKRKRRGGEQGKNVSSIGNRFLDRFDGWFSSNNYNLTLISNF